MKDLKCEYNLETVGMMKCKGCSGGRQGVCRHKSIRDSGQEDLLVVFLVIEV